MVTAFFRSQNLNSPKNDDIHMHILYEPSSPSHLYLVLDVHCKEVPCVDLSELEPRVFIVSRPDGLYVISIIH